MHNRTGRFLSTLCAVALFGCATVYAQESHIGHLTGHASAGKADYRRFCIGCHGEYGNGAGDNAPFVDPKPRDFTKGIYKCRSTPTGTLPTDQDLYKSIGRGFVTTAMPPWNPLTDQTRADLVAYIKTFSPRFKSDKPGAPLEVPSEPPVTIDSIAHGAQLFQKMECWKCHGHQGHGDGPSAATLTDDSDQPIHPYNFSTGSRFKCGTSNSDLYTIFMTGLDGTPMPSFAEVIKPNDAWDLVHYLRTLQVSRNGKENEVLKAHGRQIPAAPDAAKGPGGN